MVQEDIGETKKDRRRRFRGLYSQLKKKMKDANESTIPT